MRGVLTVRSSIIMPSLPRRSAPARRVGQGMAPEAAVAGVLRPEVLQLRHDLFGKQPGRMHRQVFRHVADVEQQEQVADAQGLDQVFQPLTHGLRAAGDDEGVVDQVLPAQGRPFGVAANIATAPPS